MEVRDLVTGNWKVHRSQVYARGTTDNLLFDLELVLQMLSPKNTLYTISPEAVLERLANSTNVGPFIHYNRGDMLKDAIMDNSCRFASIHILSHRSKFREVGIYNTLFQKGVSMRLVENPAH